MYDKFKGIDAISFGKKFRTNDDCYMYLHSIKWGNGYRCIKCGKNDAVKGRTSYHKRCKHCGYDESVTANTLFHKVKMPLLKAFHMVYRTVSKKKGMSSVELSTEVGVQQKTAWLFKLKIKNAMIQESKKKLEGKVQVDETFIGGYSKGEVGRSLVSKSAVLVAVEELNGGGTGNMQLRVIEDFSKDMLEVNINEMVTQSALLKTDSYSSYKSMQKDGKAIEIGLSDKGNFLEEIHKQILQFKCWLKGTHHKCSKNYLQTYLDEYTFRFNRRNNRASIFDSMICKIMNAAPKKYNQLIVNCVLNT